MRRTINLLKNLQNYLTLKYLLTINLMIWVILDMIFSENKLFGRIFAK